MRPDLRAIADRAIRATAGPVDIELMRDNNLDLIEWISVQNRALENLVRRNNGWMDKELLQKSLDRAERELKMEDDIPF